MSTLFFYLFGLTYSTKNVSIKVEVINVDNNIGERIKELRNDLKLSQTEFGKKLGVSRDTINNLERNRVDIKDLIIKSICHEFNVNELWLRSGDGDMFKSNDLDFDTLAAKISLSDRDDLKELIKTLWEFDVDELKAILDIVKILKKQP